MTGLENIVNQIIEEANGRADKILSEARSKADDIQKEAAEEVQKMNQEAAAKRELDRANYQERMKSSADLQKRRAILQMKQELIVQILAQAYYKLIHQKDEEYFDMIEKMLKKSVQPQDGEIYFSQKDLERMPQDFEEKIMQAAKEKNGSLTLGKTPRNMEAGFVLAYGGIEENCSIQALFDERRDELQDKVHELLFS